MILGMLQVKNLERGGNDREENPKNWAIVPYNIIPPISIMVNNEENMEHYPLAQVHKRMQNTISRMVHRPTRSVKPSEYAKSSFVDIEAKSMHCKKDTKGKGKQHQ